MKNNLRHDKLFESYLKEYEVMHEKKRVRHEKLETSKYRPDVFKWVVENKTLSESFMRYMFKEHVGVWEDISRHQKLSKNFIREFRDKVDWKFILINHEKLPNEFLLEMREHIHVQSLPTDIKQKLQIMYQLDQMT